MPWQSFDPDRKRESKNDHQQQCYVDDVFVAAHVEERRQEQEAVGRKSD